MEESIVENFAELHGNEISDDLVSYYVCFIHSGYAFFQDAWVWPDRYVEGLVCDMSNEHIAREHSNE